MAARGTLCTFELRIEDADRGVETTELVRTARHPSEDEAHLVARVLARALLQAPGIAFSKGVCAGDEPPVFVARPDGTLALWVELGLPSAERLRRACHRADQVVVVTYRRERGARLRPPAGALGERVRTLALEPELVERLARSLGRRNRWTVRRAAGRVEVTVDGDGPLSSRA